MKKGKVGLLLGEIIILGVIIIVIVKSGLIYQSELPDQQEKEVNESDKEIFLIQESVVGEQIEEVMIEEDLQLEEEWHLQSDFPGNIKGDNLFDTFDYEHEGNQIVEGGGCIYTTDMGLYGGEPKNEHQQYSIYRLKNGKWEVFASHLVDDKEWIVLEDMEGPADRNDIGNLIYHEGYLYYRLLKDLNPGEGTDRGSRDGYIYRLSEQGGEPEELAHCENLFYFYIYQDKIVFRTWSVKNNKVSYWEMGTDGDGRRLIYESRLDERRPVAYRRRFTVGGGYLYIKEGDKGDVLCINMETGNTKEIRLSEKEEIKGIYFDNGFLYSFLRYWNNEDRVTVTELFRTDIMTGMEEKILEGDIISIWVKDDCLYYVDLKNVDEGSKALFFHQLDLKSRTISAQKLFEAPIDGAGARIEMLENEVIIYVHLSGKIGGHGKTVYMRNSIEKIEECDSWDITVKEMKNGGW